ncbi:hypothetical protein MMC13_008499 [Lambiella insularis]|nr:hypothetical protein [Lambiella insularis]
MAPGTTYPGTDSTQDVMSTLEPLCQIVTPVGMLGYGFDETIIRTALQGLEGSHAPTAMVLDSGSTDGGPLKLAVGSMTAPRSAYERDFRKLLALSHEFHVPIIISSAGGDGADAHVDEFLSIIEEIVGEAQNKAYKFKTLAIYSNVPKAKVLESLATGEVKGCGSSVPALTSHDVHDAETIVAQMGHEPFIEAMTAEPDFNILIGGRAYDPSPYIAYCAHQAGEKLSSPLKPLGTQQLGGFAFMGKIMECGALCATPKSQSALATVYRNGTFDIVPLSPEVKCTPTSVAAHTLYEKSRPDILPGPGGNLDLNSSQYEQLSDGRSVRVTGAHFISCEEAGLPYTVKLEAARCIGYRTMIMGGIRDPILIGQIDDFLVRVKQFVTQQNQSASGTWEMDFHVYGANGIMGSQEPGDSSYRPREIFLVGEALASSQKLATSVASSARIACVHGPYAGQRSTSGNFAMGIGGKLEVEMGACAEFCIYHLMPLKSGEEAASRIAGNQAAGEHRKETGSPLFSWKMVEFRNPQCGDLDNRQPSPHLNGSTPAHKQLQRPADPPLHLNLFNPLILSDIAPVIRSKNSGPYDVTLDVIFSHAPIYFLIKSSKLLTPAIIARLYHLSEDEIIYCGFYDQAMAFKATIPRKRNGRMVPAGGYMEMDVHGSQQYVGLLELELNGDIKDGLLKLNL